jgi:hypothetical protein
MSNNQLHSCWYNPMDSEPNRFPFPCSLPTHSFVLSPIAVMVLSRSSSKGKMLAGMAHGSVPGIYCFRCGVSVSEAVLLGYMQPFGHPCGYRPGVLRGLALGREASFVLAYSDPGMAALVPSRSACLASMTAIVAESLLFGIDLDSATETELPCLGMDPSGRIGPVMVSV